MFDYFDYRDLPDGAVGSWQGRGSLPRTLANATGTEQPIKSASGVQFDGVDDRLISGMPTVAFTKATKVPEIPIGGTPGEGFSNNGLCRAPDGTFWMTSGGKPKAGGLRNTALVHLAADGVTILHFINLRDLFFAKYGMYPLMDVAAKGCAIDLRDDPLNPGHYTIWTVMEGSLMHVGGLFTTPYIADDTILMQQLADSIAYMPEFNRLLVYYQTGSTLRQFNPDTGAQTLSVTVGGLTYPDQVGYDPNTGAAQIWCGDNSGACTVQNVNPFTGIPIGTAITLPTMDGAIEQGVIVDNKMWVNCNGNYHDAPTPINRLIEFNYGNKLASPVIEGCAVFKEATVAGSVDFLFGPDQAGKYSGWALQTVASNLATTMGAYLNLGPGDSTTYRDGGATTGVPTRLNEHIWSWRFEPGVSIQVWCDGALVTNLTAPLTASRGPVHHHILRVSYARENGYFTSINLKALTVFGRQAGSDATIRQKAEGYMAHQFGLTGNLPSNHPYKNVAPNA